MTMFHITNCKGFLKSVLKYIGIWWSDSTICIKQKNKNNLVISTKLKCKLATVKSYKADISSVSPSSERRANVMGRGPEKSFALTKGECSKRQLYNSLRWPIYIFNLHVVDTTKLPCYPHRRSTTVF